MEDFTFLKGVIKVSCAGQLCPGFIYKLRKLSPYRELMNLVNHENKEVAKKL